MHLGMIIDTVRCIGCHTCAVMCKHENNLPRDIWWNRILTNGGEEMDTPSGEWPNNSMSYVPLNCQHCENPACVKVCPVGATTKDSENGIVLQDYDRCIGCRMCIASCPYTGVRSFNWEEPSYAIAFPVGGDVPAHQKHTVEKCILCHGRVEKGLDPACIEACPARARHFGDFDDPDSEVSKLIRERKYKQLLTDRGTKPSVYYLV